MTRKYSTGKIIILPKADIWPHEMLTAKALANAGYVVEFRVNENFDYVKSPDIIIDSEVWELKSPKSAKLVSVERNLKKASRQSSNIVLDSQRMGRLPDASIERELIKQFKLTKNISKLLFINRKRKVIDISTLI